MEGKFFRGAIAAGVIFFLLFTALSLFNYQKSVSNDDWLKNHSPWPKWNECEQSLIEYEKKYGTKQLEDNNTTCMHAQFLQESWDMAINRRSVAERNYPFYGILALGAPTILFLLFYILRWVMIGRVKA